MGAGEGTSRRRMRSPCAFGLAPINCQTGASPLNRPYFASLSSSVLYFGASSIAFLMNAASCPASTRGGGVVRVATTVPNSLKNFSWPAGEQMHSILTGFDEALWNW